ncbi:hypothetical protein RFI_31545 [Reticulomyxa filosa]|uniref:Mitochondrial carrier protein n=1 Tax=Reticulomyxa filosa TaxID=46433 RepID=X6LXI5_RETFI|nr:hypothetical protein RFI_31545 [Reticulomyxa filosa]|eukprot:ETO05847.1 hypothetical protein RFI_31545 [Reticulomyxa filosa]
MSRPSDPANIVATAHGLAGASGLFCRIIFYSFSFLKCLNTNKEEEEKKKCLKQIRWGIGYGDNISIGHVDAFPKSTSAKSKEEHEDRLTSIDERKRVEDSPLQRIYRVSKGGMKEVEEALHLHMASKYSMVNVIQEIFAEEGNILFLFYFFFFTIQTKDIIYVHYMMYIHHTYIHVYKKGISGFYKAMGSQLGGIFVSDLSYFYIVAYLKQKLYRRRDVSPWRNLWISTIGGVVNVLLTTPYWTAQTQLMLQQKRTQQLELDSKQVELPVQNHTPKGDGHDPDTDVDTDADGDTESDHDHDHSKEDRKHKQPLPKDQAEQSYQNIFDAVEQIYQKHGMSGLFKGLGPSMALVTNPIIQFVVYEWSVQLLKKLMRQSTLVIILYLYNMLYM